MRGAERKFAHQELGFIAIEGLELHASGAGLVFRLIADDEEIGAAGFGGKMRGGGSASGVKGNKRLPASTEVMLARLDGYVKIGVGLGGTDPVAVEAESGGGSRVANKIGIVLEEIDQCLALVRLGEGVLGFIGFDVEFDAYSAAAGSSGRGRCWRRGLSVEGSCVGAEEKCRDDFHGGRSSGLSGTQPCRR